MISPFFHPILAAATSDPYFRMWMIPIVFSHQIFVVCRRGSGRGVITLVSAAIVCVKIRISYCDLTFFSSTFGRRYLRPPYFRMWMIPIVFSHQIFVVCRRGSGRGVTTLVSAAIVCVKIRISYCDLTFFSSNFGRRYLRLQLPLLPPSTS